MGKVIAIANQKGGVGKTTTAVNLSACLGAQGKKTLIIDIDPQGNTSSGLGIDPRDVEESTYDCLINDTPMEAVALKTDFENLWLCPANINLAGADLELADMEQREFRLKKILSSVREMFDFVLIDCPPSLSLITLNAFTAADSVLIPIQCEYYALEGLNQVLKTVNLIKKKLNPQLETEGVVFTMYDARTNLSLEVVESVKSTLSKNIYKTIIPRNVRLAEAPSHGMPIHLYDSRSTGAESYRLLAAEVMSRGEDI